MTRRLGRGFHLRLMRFRSASPSRLPACRDEPPPREFDGATAFGYIGRQLEFGHRIPGTEGAPPDGGVARQPACARRRTRSSPSGGPTSPPRATRCRCRTSSRGSIPVRRSGFSSWLTGTPGPPPTDRSSPDSSAAVMGANDGASGVALLLGVADVLQRTPPDPALGVDLLFIDGEDYGDFTDTPNDVLIGSRYYAAHQPPGPKPLYAVLFDLVADKDLQIYQEGNSVTGAPEVVNLVWDTGPRPGLRQDLRGHAQARAHRRSPRAAEGRHSRHRRRGFRLSGVAHAVRHHRQGERESLQIVGDVAMALVRREGE